MTSLDKHHNNIINRFVPEIHPVNALHEELKHFIHCIYQNKSPIISAELAIESLDIALQIQNIIENDKTI